MYCSNCGAVNANDSVFCSKCGTPTGAWKPSAPVAMPPPQVLNVPTRKRRAWPIAAVIVVVIVVALTAVAVIAVLLQSQSNGGGILPPSRSSALTLSLHNDDWLNSRSYEVYIDGNQQDSGTIGAVSTSSLYYVVTWRGDSTHQCTIDVYSNGAKHTTTAWLTDGGSASASVTI